MNQAQEYIHQSSDLQRRIFTLVRGVIMNASPMMEESYSYKVPFYSCYGKICYLNRYKKGVDIGFVRGSELSDPEGKLVAGDRKTVRSLRWFDIDEFDEQLLRTTLQEAILLDEYYHREKKKK